MNFKPLSALVLAASLLTLAPGCKDNPTNPTPTQTSVLGTWVADSVNGSAAAPMGMTWTFRQNTLSVTRTLDACLATLGYTTGNGKLYLTITNEGCNLTPTGARDTISYSISGEVMRLTQRTTTFVLRKATGLRQVIGSWDVVKVDTDSIPLGGMELLISSQAMTLITSDSTGSCRTMFAYTNDGTQLHVVVTQDECGVLNTGDTDLISWTVSGETLTLTFSDGTTLVAKRR